MSRVAPIPEGHHTVTPYVIVPDAAAAIEFYRRALGARETERHSDENGKILHAEIEIGDSRVMMAEEFDFAGIVARSPGTLGGTSQQLYLYVEDVDAWMERVLAAGAELVQPVSDQYYGDRSGGLRDPFGHIWWIATHVEDLSAEELQRRKRER